jgi:A/G-specific adenine glycosylase
VSTHLPDVARTVTTSGSNDYATFRRALRRVSPQLARPLPWIGHPDPWAILVSEFMLQQTTTSRVLEPWARFLDALPTPSACANAPLARVLRLWSGLGYHRRAKALHDAARRIRDDFGGVVPNDVADLRSLPGVGEYTAHAIASFAFSRHVAVLDTNVGRVLLPRSNVAEFNQALLDLGATFCRATPRCEICPVVKACRWRREGGRDPAPHSAGVSRPQSKFEGSDRQVRGRILAALRSTEQTATQLQSGMEASDTPHFTNILQSLISDGLVERVGRIVRLVGDE